MASDTAVYRAHLDSYRFPTQVLHLCLFTLVLEIGINVLKQRCVQLSILMLSKGICFEQIHLKKARGFIFSAALAISLP